LYYFINYNRKDFACCAKNRQILIFGAKKTSKFFQLAARKFSPIFFSCQNFRAKKLCLFRGVLFWRLENLAILVMKPFQKLSAMTLKSYNVRGHLDHEGPALCYPRFRSARGIDGRRPVGLKLIRLLGEKLEKRNYPTSEEDEYVFIIL
jgi:hypothetical protein